MYKYCIKAPTSFPQKYIHITASELGITSVFFEDEPLGEQQESPIIEQSVTELNQYFKGQLTTFNVAVDVQGSDFQKKVWASLRRIPYGKTISYQELAIDIGSKNYCRAVGMANSKNPIAIIIPCHRVIGKNGQLVGYAGGVDIKHYLLAHEQKNRHQENNHAQY